MDTPGMERVLDEDLLADTLGGLFWYRAARSAQETGFRFEDRQYTHAEMAAMAGRLRSSLAREGMEPGSRVAAYMYNSPWMLALLLACAMDRLVFCPLNPLLRIDDLAYALGDLEPAAVFADGELSEVVAAVKQRMELPPVIVVGSPAQPVADARALEDWLDPAPGRSEPPGAQPGDPLCIIYSGGTTGLPKGIVMPQFAPVGAALRFNRIAAFGKHEIFFSVLQLSHAWTPLLALPFCLYYGHTFCFWKWWSATRFTERLRSYGATLTDPFIGMIATLLQTPAGPADGALWVRVVAGLGGSDPVCMRLRGEFEKRFGATTFDLYGLTEVTGLVAVETERSARKPGSAGPLSGWYDVCIGGPNDMPCPAGTTGEILVRPRIPYTVGLGYHRKESVTVSTWRNLWIHTGDLGYLDEDGYLFFVGRRNHFLRRRGELVSAAEVENTLMGYPGIVEVAVVAAKSAFGEDEVRACVVTREGDFDPGGLIEYCRTRLAAFKLPKYIDLLEALPRTGSKREIERFRLQQRPLELAWDRDQPRRFPQDWPARRSRSAQP